MKKTIAILTLLTAIMTNLFAQSKALFEADTFKTDKGREVVITFIKHGTLMMTVDGYTIHIDPVTMFGTDYSQLPKADLVLVSHEHPDHFDIKAIKMVKKSDTRCFGNHVVAQGIPNCMPLAPEQTITPRDYISITATLAYNITKGHEQFHPKGHGIGFLIAIDNMKFYIAGDTEDIVELEMLKDIDVAFLPVNQPYTMTTDQCIHAIHMLMPKVVYPYHYGETDLTPIVKHFDGNKEVEVRIRQMQ